MIFILAAELGAAVRSVKSECTEEVVTTTSCVCMCESNVRVKVVCACASQKSLSGPGNYVVVTKQNRVTLMQLTRAAALVSGPLPSDRFCLSTL